MDPMIETIIMVKESLSGEKTIMNEDSMMESLLEATTIMETEDHLIVKIVGTIKTIMRQVIVDSKVIEAPNISVPANKTNIDARLYVRTLCVCACVCEIYRFLFDFSQG